jgi:hypothetical protein
MSQGFKPLAGYATDAKFSISSTLLLGMSQTMASRSVRIDGAGLDKVRQRMAELEKPLNPDKRGWSKEDLARQAYVHLSTVKRFLKVRHPIAVLSSQFLKH